MQRHKLIFTLQEISKTNLTGVLHKDALVCLYNLLTILSMENDIIKYSSTEVLTLVQDTIRTPVLGLENHYKDLITGLTAQQQKDAMAVLPLLSSPIIKVISTEKREQLEGFLIVLTYSVLSPTWLQDPPQLPENFSLVKELLKSPGIRERLFYRGIHYRTPIILWSLLNDITILQYLKAKDFNTRFKALYDPFPKRVLENYLHTKNIDPGLFWELVHSTPDIPALTLLELLENPS